MPNVILDDKEWQQVLAIIGDAPWKFANPLLMKIGQQLRAQEAGAQALANPPVSPTLVPQKPSKGDRSHVREVRHDE